jgi:hypothetical protein
MPLKSGPSDTAAQIASASDALAQSLQLLRRPVYPWAPGEEDLVERLVETAPNSDPAVLADQVRHIFAVVRDPNTKAQQP